MNRNPSAGLAGIRSLITSSTVAAPVALHNPQRVEGESFAAYKARRATAQKAASRIAGQGLNGGTNSRRSFRNSMRENWTMGKRVRASDAILAAIASKCVPNWRGPRDEHGAVCLIGKPYDLDGIHPSSRELVLTGWVDGEDFGYTVRRKWMAGISAQRGY